MDTLPIEILEIIIEYLPPVNRYRFYLTCKEYYNYHDEFESYFLSKSITSAKLEIEHMIPGISEMLNKFESLYLAGLEIFYILHSIIHHEILTRDTKIFNFAIADTDDQFIWDWFAGQGFINKYENFYIGNFKDLYIHEDKHITITKILTNNKSALLNPIYDGRNIAFDFSQIIKKQAVLTLNKEHSYHGRSANLMPQIALELDKQIGNGLLENISLNKYVKLRQPLRVPQKIIKKTKNYTKLGYKIIIL